MVYINWKAWRRSPISNRLITYTILFSMVMTFIASAIQLYIEYKSDINAVHEEFGEIRDSYMNSISLNLWLLDRAQLSEQLKGILRHRYISYAAIISNGKLLYHAGDKTRARRIHASFPLTHVYDGRKISLGKLYLSSTMEQVYGHVLNEVWLILLSNGVIIFAIAIFLSFIYTQLVSRHLYDISNYTRSLVLGEHKEKLVLNRVRRSDYKDELDDVVDSLNTLYISAENAISDSEKNRRVFEDYTRASSDWYWQIDSDYRFTEISSNFEKITGDDVSQYIGKTRWDYRPEGNNQHIWDEYTNILKSHKPFTRFEYSSLGENGKRRYYSLSGVPVFNESGEFEGYRGTARDITEIKNLEKQLIHSQKLDAVGRLAGGVAHDYNNMLNVILGNIELLELTAKSNEDSLKYLENAKEATLRSVGLTRKLLGFARTDTQDARPTSVNDVIDGLETLISKSLTAAIKIETCLAKETWLVKIDPSELEDCILNLSINARDAMPNGGVLTLASENKTLSQEEIAGIKQATPGDYVVVSASDTGMGMSKDVMDNIFEPFFTTKIKGRGTGLGLSMVANFVQRAKGFVTVESERGKGSCFRIHLPRYYVTEERQQHLDPQEEHTVLPAGNEKILAVDDEEYLLALCREQLESLGYLVITANSGEKALEIINNNTDIDLLFCDIIMPGKLDGIQLGLAVSKIRPDLKIQLVSGYTDPQVIKSFEEHAKIGEWMRNILHKPYTVSELAHAVRLALDAA